ncbi:hypothetical protein [Halobacterium salinarum]|uniref:hypothetical protein n=1 Tax=Halobacterium salinarum TaxID=2242 RepID=UPI002554470C|nr:hypothetical protein [Halobacterium salinarum]MDL0145593.1 hypothetical protein [Halobacterium salinarum]
MSDSDSYEINASAPNHPDAKHVDAHLVIDKSEWVPGKHPDPQQRHEGQTEYLERYIQCLRCGQEALNERDLPVECDRR